MPRWSKVALTVLGVGTVAALWWALRSGEPAAWSIFFSQVAMIISLSGWASRHRQKNPPQSRRSP